MGLYPYRCSVCKKSFELVQSVEGSHQAAQCPECGGNGARVFTPPQVKKNEGFFSQQLGREVTGQKDLDTGLEKVYFKADINEELGNNYTPKDEWIAESEAERAVREKRQTEVDEWHQESGYYTSVETFDLEKETRDADRLLTEAKERTR